MAKHNISLPFANGNLLNGLSLLSIRYYIDVQHGTLLLKIKDDNINSFRWIISDHVLRTMKVMSTSFVVHIFSKYSNKINNER